MASAKLDRGRPRSEPKAADPNTRVPSRALRKICRLLSTVCFLSALSLLLVSRSPDASPQAASLARSDPTRADSVVRVNDTFFSPNDREGEEQGRCGIVAGCRR